MRNRRVAAALTSCATIAMYAGLSAGPAVAVTAPGTTWDTQDEFTAAGTTLNNTVTTSVDDGEVRLSEETKAFPFIWVALSARGTIAKVDTVTGEVLGEYRSAPTSVTSSPDPSRTTVGKDGSVWSGNRQLAAVVHVGVVETGQCVDRNGNGTIDTSSGYGDVKPWFGGGAAGAADECILHYVPTYGGDARHVSVDADGYIWVGNYMGSPHRFHRIDPSTGAITRTQDAPCGGYGGLVDRDGVIWSASPSQYQILRWDPDAGIPGCVSVPNYGLAEDSGGNIWASNYGYDTNVRKLSPAGSLLGVYSLHRYMPYAQGLAVSQDSAGNDHVWVSSSLAGGSNVISHLLGDGTWVGNVTGVGAGSTGVAVDAAGKIWTANLESSNATRIDPEAGPVSTTVPSMRIGAFDKMVAFGSTTGMGPGYPYNYSDMTGSSLRGAPDSGTWNAVYDSGTAGAEWGTVTWTAQVPAGANLSVKVATSDDPAAFGPGVDVQNGTAFAQAGRYVKVSVVLGRAPGGDSAGSPVLEELTLLPANRPPVADAGADQTVGEGSLVTLDGSGSTDPDGDAMTYAWTLRAGYSGPEVTLDDAHSVTPTFGTVDDGVYTFEVTVSDDDGVTDTDEVQVTVTNVAPEISGFTVPVDPVPITQPVAMSALFADAGTGDTHGASFTLDSMSTAGTVQETGGAGSASAAVSVSVPGVYVASVTVTDDDGGSDTETASVPVVVYDPSAGFVTGGGWITSPAGAYVDDPTLTGKASFGFVSRYAKGATVPSGNTEFAFQAAGLKFKSTSYDWLVVAGAKAQYKGVGTLNGVGGYRFMLTAVDGQLSGGGGTDKFRIKIWDALDTIVYDNQMEDLDSAPLDTALGGGSVVIHK